LKTLSDIASALQTNLHGADRAFTRLVVDSREVKSGDVYIALQGHNHDGHQFIDAAKRQGAVGAIVSKAGSGQFPTIQVSDTHVALMDLARMHRAKMSHAKAVAVTGSCGKTTTRALMEAIFAQAGPTLASIKSYNNNIGVPLTLLNLRPEHAFLISEMGANHSGEIAELTHMVKPDVAIITLAAPAHLEGFGSMEGIACAKGEIFQGLTEDGVAVINADDQYARFWTRLAGTKRILTFGLREKADVSAKDIRLHDDGTSSFVLCFENQSVPVHLQLIGQHNVMNALAAAAAGFALDLSALQIATGLSQANTEKNRLVSLSGMNGSRIIDDSYNANPSSMQAAIDVLSNFGGDKVLVMGDMLELGNSMHSYHAQIGKFAKEKGVQQLYCYGPYSRHAADAFGAKAYHFDDQAELITALKKQLHDEVTVLIKGSNSMHMHRIADAITKE